LRQQWIIKISRRILFCPDSIFNATLPHAFSSLQCVSRIWIVQLGYGGLVLDLSLFTSTPAASKMMLASKVVKSDFKINVRLAG